ncbi:MAG: hypothetical protein KDD03_13080, partial [Gelidibacter sp.]|nr:hypothetical protein [Gelidibacter sp.]
MAINFKRKQEGENGDGLTPPKTLEGIGLTSAEIITRENYKVFGDEYGVELPEPQENMISKPKHYSGNTEFIKDEHRTTTPDNIPIDPDYVARKVKGHFSISYTASRSRGNWADFFYNIGSVEDGEWNLRGGKD